MNESKGKHAPGPWYEASLGNAYQRLVVDEKTGANIAVVYDEANARLIVAAVNSCFQINPLNPLAVAEALPELVEATQSVMIKLCDLMNPGLDRPRPDLEEMHDGLAAALAKIGAKGK